MKLWNWEALLGGSTAGLMFLACAPGAINKHIDREMSEETEIRSRNDLRTETAELIRTAPGLSDQQRTKLTELAETTRVQLDEIQKQTLQLRSVLIKNVITVDYKEDEVAVIKQRIRFGEQR